MGAADDNVGHYLARMSDLDSFVTFCWEHRRGVGYLDLAALVHKERLQRLVTFGFRFWCDVDPEIAATSYFRKVIIRNVGTFT